MRVLFVATVDPSAKSGHNIATKEVISAIIRNPDIELSVIIPLPSEKYKHYVIGNTKIASFLSAKRQRSFWWNLKLQFQLAYKFISIVKREKPHLIITRMGNCIALPILSHLYNIPYYVLIRGLASRDMKNMTKVPGFYLYSKIVTFINCRIASQVIVAYDEIKQEVKNYRKANQAPPIIFTNAVNPKLFPLCDKIDARNKIGLDLNPSDFVVGHVGSLKKRHCLMYLLKAVKEAKNEIKNIKVLIVGEGPQLSILKQYVKDKAMDEYVLFTGFIPHEKVFLYMASSDVLYGAIDPLEVENPIKCYEYLASARPVITSEKEEFDFVRELGLGVTLKQLDAAEIFKAIRYFHSYGEQELYNKGIEGREYVLKNHTWDQLIDTITNDFYNIDSPNFLSLRL